MAKYSAIDTGRMSIPGSNLSRSHSRRDPLLQRIDALLRLYRWARRDWRMLPVLSLLFLAMDRWLRENADRPASCERFGSVYATYLSTATKLCSLYNCSLESVPKGIEQMFGLDMIREGYNNDANDVLTEAIDETSIW